MTIPISDQTIERRPATVFYEEIQTPTGSGVDRTDVLINAPGGTRVVDAYMDVKVAATGAGSGTTAIQTSEAVPKVIIPATSHHAAALTRMVTGDNHQAAVDTTIDAVIDNTGANDTAATIGIYMLLVRDDYSLA